jgi:hypothetical protein
MPIRKHKIFPALGCSAASIGFAAFAIVFAATPATSAIWRVAARIGSSDPFSRGRGLGICRNF